MVFFSRSYLHADSGVKLGFDFGLSLLGPGLIMKPVFAPSLQYNMYEKSFPYSSILLENEKDFLDIHIIRK